ncbi:MAG: TadE/TadG family type IV pilus assembly protein [Acidimicrobiales bacterium]
MSPIVAGIGIATAGQFQGSAPVDSPAGAVAGQSTAELAILLPVLMILTLTVVQVGLVARDVVVVHHAAREAARAVAIEPVVEEAVAGAERASSALDPDRLAVGLRGGRSTGDLLTVEVDYRAPTDVPVVGSLIGDIGVSAKAVVRVE